MYAIRSYYDRFDKSKDVVEEYLKDHSYDKTEYRCLQVSQIKAVEKGVV